ncbi:iron-containing alcohol dehydrogenase [Salinarimonas sp.]|uniref:iron-containing alcohol dehydrogenase n=1 Tax=Salinarimonas sp. TaxID=2766526 RepID=UPI003918F2B3
MSAPAEVLAPFEFGPSGRILFGRGRAREAAGLATGLGRRIVLVHGARGERAAWLTADLEAAGAALLAIACPSEPTLAMLEEALAAARAHRVEVVVALGGGAAIDLAKALAALAPGEGAPLDHLEVVGRGLPLGAAPLPMLALPTTAGTGAEVTRNAVIGVPQEGRKVSLRDPRMVPAIAIVDPALTDGAPRAVTLASGLDALSQLVEPFLSLRASPVTDALVRSALPGGLAALVRLTGEDGATEDPGARDAMAYASLCGGLALAHAGLGGVHALAGVIGGMTRAPHGAVCGALLVPVLERLRAAATAGSALEARLGEIDAMAARALGVAPDAALGALEAFVARAGLPRLAALGVAPALHEEIARLATSSSSARTSPVAFEARDYGEILRRGG